MWADWLHLTLSVPSAQCLPTDQDRVLIPHSGRRADLGSELRGRWAAPGHYHVVQAWGPPSCPAPGTEWNVAAGWNLASWVGDGQPWGKDPEALAGNPGAVLPAARVDRGSPQRSDEGGLGRGLAQSVTLWPLHFLSPSFPIYPPGPRLPPAAVSDVRGRLGRVRVPGEQQHRCPGGVHRGFSLPRCWQPLR